MKIAVATDDGRTISRRLGRAPYYLVFTVNRGQLVDKEQREKPGPGQFTHEPSRIMDVIRDCDAIIAADVICGTYLEMKECNIHPFVTELEDAEQAIMGFIDGQLADYVEWLH